MSRQASRRHAGAGRTRGDATATATTGKGFFGTSAGKLALVVMAAGTGFMVYSAFSDNDPVPSQFR